ncbi:helix-turn-helix domain-containing protein [Flavobacterium sp. RHBU_24]|uniref:helix-turn-helix domain-containing protein n=1 Tax=Flavobacterium sp. RHBU_24 TaxID=3391185 RepID=UPI003985692F
METETVKKIIQKGFISDELELERALILDRKLKLLSDENPELKEPRKILRRIIKEYEDKNWSADAVISDEKIKESDNAEFIAEQERLFIQKRKEIIIDKLNKFDLNQQDLGLILGHSKSYISELINGISPFVLKDLIIIHRVLKIRIENLVPTIIPQKDRIRVRKSIQKINKPALKLTNKDLKFI